ncbi:MAG: Hsp20/alpha crystallin family protein [Pirellulales bacterium]|nr:Hsp20/alpha crystallin family protein [Pirellulales bacterium]
MNLIPWKHKSASEPLRTSTALASLRSDMDRLFDAFVREPFGALESSFRDFGAWSPAVDLAETDTEYTVRAELPGLAPEDLEVSVTENQLVLSGEKKETTEQNEKGYYHSESRYGSFRRNIPLPGAVDSTKVDAEYRNGVLTIHLAKSPQNASKRIEVKVKKS